MREEIHSPADLAGGAAVTLRLRLLQTTDVHSNLLAHDYYSNRDVPDYGLTRAATLIRRLRAEMPNALLFDSGDFLQGTPLSDLITLNELSSGEVHPTILAMNALGYDAASLGNHEFNFGLDWLKAALAPAEFPITCANLLAVGGTAASEPLFAPYLLLDRQLMDAQGKRHSLRIGVIGFIPPQVTTWDMQHLTGRAESRDIPETARFYAPRMRAAGADLVIALAHSGITASPVEPLMENAALPLGAVSGIDAILAGHTHEVFPSPDFNAVRGVCPVEGRLNGTPTVMAGARASHIGVLDLDLTRKHQGWRVNSAKAEAIPVDPGSPPDRDLTDLLQTAHARTIRRTSRRLGKTDVPLHSYLDLAAPSAAMMLIDRAKVEAVEEVLKGTGEEGIPVLAASAPFKTGGRGGPGYYTDIPPGDLCLRHAADLYSFPNLLCAVRVTGRDLRDWLERAAVIFKRITPGLPGQCLIDRSLPGHHFDMIAGLDYEIDVSQPARFNRTGKLNHPHARRIRNLRFEGETVGDERSFILATNNYRAQGGGPFAAVPADRFLPVGNRLIRDVLADHISRLETVSEPRGLHRRNGWAFARLPDTSVIYETGPGLRHYPEEIKAVGARNLGRSDAGFLRLELPLG
jgi:2',3'-cyclic-nucleotide 2'-phosphodiesterase/3'-nucleotidase